jgi:hypothetical protein
MWVFREFGLNYERGLIMMSTCRYRLPILIIIGGINRLEVVIGVGGDKPTPSIYHSNPDSFVIWQTHPARQME